MGLATNTGRSGCSGPTGNLPPKLTGWAKACSGCNVGMSFNCARVKGLEGLGGNPAGLITGSCGTLPKSGPGLESCTGLGGNTAGRITGSCGTLPKSGPGLGSCTGLGGNPAGLITGSCGTPPKSGRSLGSCTGWSGILAKSIGLGIPVGIGFKSSGNISKSSSSGLCLS